MPKKPTRLVPEIDYVEKKGLGEKRIKKAKSLTIGLETIARQEKKEGTIFTQFVGHQKHWKVSTISSRQIIKFTMQRSLLSFHLKSLA